MELNLWLDDKRDPNERDKWGRRINCQVAGWQDDEIDWTWVRSVNSAIELLDNHDDTFARASLDHDLGMYAEYGGDGINFVKWMIEMELFPTTLVIHSANPVGVQNMLFDIDATGWYTPIPRQRWRGEHPGGTDHGNFLGRQF